MSDTFDPDRYDTKKAAYDAGKKEGYLSALDGEKDDSSDDTLTIEKVQQMSQDEINSRWDEVRELLEKSGAA